MRAYSNRFPTTLGGCPLSFTARSAKVQRLRWGASTVDLTPDQRDRVEQALTLDDVRAAHGIWVEAILNGKHSTA